MHHSGKHLRCIAAIAVCLRFLSGCKGEDSCIPGDPFVCDVPCKCVTILAGSPAEFSCTVQTLENSLWDVQRPDNIYNQFAQNGLLFSQYQEKLTLRVINKSSGMDNDSYLQIVTLREATVDDDGMFRCHEDGEIRNLTYLTVETPPVLKVEIDGIIINMDIDVVNNKEIAIDCISEGGKPQVTLSWLVNGVEINDCFIDDQPPSSDGRVTSTVHYKPSSGDDIVTCMASGQKITTETNVSVGLNVQDLPNCVLSHGKNTTHYLLTCSCKANPVVTTYRFYVNDSLFSQKKEAILPLNKGGKVKCIAANAIGSSESQSENLKAFHVNHREPGIQVRGIIGIVLAFIIIIIIIIAVKQINKKCRGNDAGNRFRDIFVTFVKNIRRNEDTQYRNGPDPGPPEDNQDEEEEQETSVWLPADGGTHS